MVLDLDPKLISVFNQCSYFILFVFPHIENIKICSLSYVQCVQGLGLFVVIIIIIFIIIIIIIHCH